MKTFQRVLRAQTVREAIAYIPDVFYERCAVVVLTYWLIMPLLLSWVGDAIGMDIRFLRWVNLQVGVAALALALLLLAARRSEADLAPARDPLRDNLPLALFGVFLVLALTASLVNPTDATWDGDWYRGESMLTFISYVGFFFLASQVLSFSRRRLLIAFVLGLVLATCVVSLFSAVVEAAGTGAWSSPHRLTAYFHQFNHYGYLLAVGGALAAAGALVAHRRGARWALLAVFGVVLLTLLFNDTLGAYVALAVGCLAVVVWLAVIRRLEVRRALAIAAVAVVAHVVAEAAGIGILAELGSLGEDVRAVSVGAAEASSAGTGRWGLWVTTIEQIVVSPWIGQGIEGIADQLPGGFGRPHNEYLQYAVFFGVPALIAYVGAVAVIFTRVVKRGPTVDDVTVCAATAAATYLVSACFGNSMYYTAPLLFLLLGLVWGGVRLNGGEVGAAVIARRATVGY